MGISGKCWPQGKWTRYGLVLLIVCLLGVISLGSRVGWWRRAMGEIKASSVIECPALEKGCAFSLVNKPYVLKSHSGIEAGQPFMLELIGDASDVRASWRMLSMDMGPNNYQLLAPKPQHWQAQMTLPPCPHGGKKWQLHLEFDGQAIDVNTKIR